MKFKRKVQTHGGSLSINIPSEWAEEQGLKVGEFIEVEDQGPNLILRKITKNLFER